MEVGNSNPNDSSVIIKVRPWPPRTPLVPMETNWDKPACTNWAATSAAATFSTCTSLVTREHNASFNGQKAKTRIVLKMVEPMQY